MNVKEENGTCTIEYGFPGKEGDTEFEMKIISNNPDKEYKNSNKNIIDKKIRDEFDAITRKKYQQASEEEDKEN